MRRNRLTAFTLIELLTVIAISAILMTLIILPVFQSFNLTRTAQAFADAQDKGRILTERIAREIGNAVSVRGGEGKVGTVVNGVEARVPFNTLVVRVPRLNADGTVRSPRSEIDIVLPNVKLDLVRPAEGDPARGPSGGFIDPVTGKEDPTLRNPKGQAVLPVAPGATIVRYFVGLRDPFRPYNNPYDGLLMQRAGGRDNLYVLYRAEVQPRVYSSDGYLANTEFFEESENGQPILDDPRFFLANVDGEGNLITTDERADRIRNWLRRAVVQTEVSRYDMIQPVFNRANRRVLMNGNVPNIIPLVQFRPTRVSNDPAEGQVAVRQGEEFANAGAAAPDVFTTQMGLWTNALVRMWPVGWNANDSASNEYLVGRYDPRNGLDDGTQYAPGFSIYAYDPDAAADDYLAGVELFDLYTYDRVLNTGNRYPFTQARAAANGRSGWFSNPRLRAMFTPFALDAAKGKIISSFGVSEVGNPEVSPPGNNSTNLPVAFGSREGENQAYTPTTGDPYLAGTIGDDNHAPSSQGSSINALYNLVFKRWQEDPNLQGLDASRIQRFIDLRVLPQADGSEGPLTPVGHKVSIVPGSEEVEGPDQNPGPNYGNRVRYVRTTGIPGPNQYRINYTDLPEPTDYTLLGLTPAAVAGFDRNTYNRDNFVSAIIQPQFKAGYIQLCSDPNVPIPADAPNVPNGPIQNESEIRVNYRFQFTASRTGSSATLPGAARDVFAVDYDSRQLMNVLLTIRNYPQSSVPNPQTITLQSTAKVRNYIR